ncbi:hypothetical protein D3C80_1477840 [compost metagenome]
MADHQGLRLRRTNQPGTPVHDRALRWPAHRVARADPRQTPRQGPAEMAHRRRLHRLERAEQEHLRPQKRAGSRNAAPGGQGHEEVRAGQPTALHRADRELVGRAGPVCRRAAAYRHLMAAWRIVRNGEPRRYSGNPPGRRPSERPDHPLADCDSSQPGRADDGSGSPGQVQVQQRGGGHHRPNANHYQRRQLQAPCGCSSCHGRVHSLHRAGQRRVQHHPGQGRG